MENIIENQWSCYILKSLNPLYQNRTYVGSTNSVKRRIRQHNGNLTGGARATSIMRPNEFMCVLTGFPNKISALRCEWLLKHPNGTRKGNEKYSGIVGKINGVNYLLTQSEKWKIRSENCNIKIWIKEDLVGHLDINMFGNNIEVFLC